MNASPQVLRSLARVLRLSRSEQAYLFQLARPDLDWRNRLGEQGLPSAPLLSLLEGLAPHPAYIVNRYWQVVAWNHPATVLLGNFETDDEWSGSLIARLFLDPEWRQRFVDWPEVSRSAVAQFRLATVAMTRDPVLAALVSSLEAASEAFRRLLEQPRHRRAADLAEIHPAPCRRRDGVRFRNAATGRTRQRFFRVGLHTGRSADRQTVRGAGRGNARQPQGGAGRRCAENAGAKRRPSC